MRSKRQRCSNSDAAVPSGVYINVRHHDLHRCFNTNWLYPRHGTMKRDRFITEVQDVTHGWPYPGSGTDCCWIVCFCDTRDSVQVATLVSGFFWLRCVKVTASVLWEYNLLSCRRWCDRTCVNFCAPLKACHHNCWSDERLPMQMPMLSRDSFRCCPWLHWGYRVLRPEMLRLP